MINVCVWPTPLRLQYMILTQGTSIYVQGKIIINVVSFPSLLYNNSYMFGRFVWLRTSCAFFVIIPVVFIVSLFHISL